jgi:hypothetical protein
LLIILVTIFLPGQLFSQNTPITDNAQVKKNWMDWCQKVDFSQVAEGKMPANWKVDATNPTGKLAEWGVIKDETAPGGKAFGITKIHDPSEGVLNLCFTDVSDFKGGNIQVKIKANGGKVDQGGGLIWRAKDAKNYYLARYNVGENFRIYKVIDGKRTMLAEVKDINIPVGEWFTIRVETHGSGAEIRINGGDEVEIDDTSLTEPGYVGFWTKADAASSFSEIVIGKGVVNTRFGSWLESTGPPADIQKKLDGIKD